MDRLLKLLVVEDGSDLAVAVARPVRSAHLNLRLANIGPTNRLNYFTEKRMVIILTLYHLPLDLRENPLVS